MDKILNGRTALVTGSTSGIGLGIAQLLAEAGAKVMLNGFGKPEEIAHARAEVGAAMGVAEARAAGHADLRIHRWPLSENDRAIAEGRPEGMVKLVVTARGRLLGAGILAPRAGEMAGMFGLMIGRKLPLSALAGLVVPYPTLAEAAKRAAGNFYAPRLLSPFAKRITGLLKLLP